MEETTSRYFTTMGVREYLEYRRDCSIFQSPSRSRCCTGRKRPKERLTCAFFVNSSGVKEKPIVIRKSANPRCLTGIANKADLPCRYFNQPKAWMKTDILEEIRGRLNGRLRRQNCKIIFFYRQCSMPSRRSGRQILAN